MVIANLYDNSSPTTNKQTRRESEKMRQQIPIITLWLPNVDKQNMTHQTLICTDTASNVRIQMAVIRSVMHFNGFAVSPIT